MKEPIRRILNEKKKIGFRSKEKEKKKKGIKKGRKKKKRLRRLKKI